MFHRVVVARSNSSRTGVEPQSNRSRIVVVVTALFLDFHEVNKKAKLKGANENRPKIKVCMPK